jgi:hypothetical protein
MLQAIWFIAAGVLLWREKNEAYACNPSSAFQFSGSSVSEAAATFSSR